MQAKNLPRHQEVGLGHYSRFCFFLFVFSPQSFTGECFSPDIFHADFWSRAQCWAVPVPSALLVRAGGARCAVLHLRLTPDLWSEQLQPMQWLFASQVMLIPKSVQHKSQRAASLSFSRWEFLLQIPLWWWRWRREKFPWTLVVPQQDL